MTAAARAAVAVDIGGTKISSALVQPDGTVTGRSSRPTPRGADGDTTWLAVAESVETALGHADGAVRGVGIGTAGPLDPAAGTVSPVNIPGWRGYPLLRRTRERFPDLPMVLEGDTMCLALGEYLHGVGQGSAAMLGMVVSTGVGGGLIINGELYRGPSTNAGHIGHAIAEPDGAACPCGSRGCVETVSSGPSMVRWARAHGWDAPAEAGARELARDARQGHQVARRAFERSARALGIAIVGAAALVDIDRVVIGGGVSAAGELLFAPLRATVAEFARMEFLRRMTIEEAALGELGPLIGASELV